jgi:tape measure domain-containing protein
MNSTSKSFTLSFEGEHSSLMASIDKVSNAAKGLKSSISSITLVSPKDAGDMWTAKLRLISEQAQKTEKIIKQLNAAGEDILVRGRGGSSTDSEFKRKAEMMKNLLAVRNMTLKNALAQEEAMLKGNLDRVAQLQAQKDSRLVSMKSQRGINQVQEKFQAGTLNRGEMIAEIRAIKAREEAELKSIQARLHAELSLQRSLREAEQTRLSQFSNFLREREAMLRADINVQRQIEISGMHSIETYRAEANRKRLAAEQDYRRRISIIESSVQGGTSSTVGQQKATEAMREYLRTLKTVDAQLGVHERALQKTEVAHKAMWLRVVEVTAVYRIWAAAIHRGHQALLSVPATGIHFEGTKAGLQAVSGSAAGAYREMAFLNHEATRTGLALDGIRASFRSFAASAVTSGESMQTVEKIFSNVNTMATTLHLSVDDVNGIFLALGQTFNKGKLQSEELVKQLAQRVPGSVVLMAKAYAKAEESVQSATQRLLHDMKLGNVAAHENIAKLGEEMVKMFGGEAFIHASTGLNSEIGRLETSWTHLTENIYKASSKSMMSVLGFTTDGIEGLSAMAENTLELENTFNTIGETIKRFAVLMAGAIGVMGAYKIAASPVVAMFGVWRATWLGLNAAILASPVVVVSTLIASLAGLSAQLDSIREKRKALETLAFTPEEAPKTPAQEFSYKIDQDPRVKELNFALEAASKDVEKFSAKAFGKLLAPEELKRAEAVQAAIFDKMILKRREVAAELKTQANLGNVTDDSTIQETDYERSSRYHEKLTKQIEDRIGTLQKQKQLEIDTLNEKAKMAEDRTGKEVDPVSLKQKTWEITKKYHEQINALLKEKISLTEAGEQKTLESAGKSITAFDKLVKIMRTLESKGRIDAVSPVGAVGKHQVMPSTLAHGNYGDRVQGIPEAELQTAIKYEMVGRRTRRMTPQMYAYLRNFATKYSDKIADFGVNELRKNFEHFNGDASKALAAYNAGRGAVEKLQKSRGANWMSGLLPETKNYVREGIRLGAPKAAGELDKYEGQRSSLRAQVEEQDILAKKEALTAESIAAQREKALRLEREKAAEQVAKNTLANEELQIAVDSFKQNQLTADLAKITYDFNKEKLELEKNGNFAGVEILKIKTAQLRVQATLADAERKVARDAEIAAIAENALMVKKNAGIITEKQFAMELSDIKEAQLPGLEEELRLVSEITKEEDRRVASLKVQAQIEEVKRNMLLSLNQPSAGGDYLTQKRESSDPTNYKDYAAQRESLISGQADEMRGITPIGMADKEGQLQSHETFLQQKNALDAKYADANFINQSNYYSGVASLGAETFQGITSHMIAMYGAQSKQARIAFIAYKAFMVSQTIMNTAAAIVAQLSNPTPYVGVALAAMAATTGAIQVAKIIAEPMPQAHGGLEYVPEDATYKLSKGERILAPKQNEAFMRLNQDLSAKMQRENREPKAERLVKPPIVKPQIKVVNIDYSSQEIERHLTSTAGEEIIVNHMMRNREAIA